jgi:hypothetical protein
VKENGLTCGTVPHCCGETGITSGAEGDDIIEANRGGFARRAGGVARRAGEISRAAGISYWYQ